MTNPINFSETVAINNRNRTTLTKIIVFVGFAIILALGLITILIAWPDGEENIKTAKWVFNAIIPLIASWIGTVIAFYFGRDNFETATQSVLALTADKLDDLSVNNMMINLKTIVAQKLDKGEEKNKTIEGLVELYKEIDKDRVPIFSKDLLPRFIIHRSSMIEYLSENPTSDGSKISLDKMLNGNQDKFGHKLDKGFITIPKNISVQVAKERMDQASNCRDAFVTEDGTPNTKVLGWLTDTLISRFLDVKVK